MKRREFITLIGGATAWPLAARAQQGERIRRIGWLTASLALNDPEIQARNAKFVERLRELGWVEGNNVQIDFRSGAGNVDVARKHAAELVTVAVAEFGGLDAMQASSTASLSRAATRQDLRRLSTQLERNGWRFSRRSRPPSSG